MRLTQFVEAANFVELPPPNRADRPIGLIYKAIDHHTGIGWLLDPKMFWREPWSRVDIDKQVKSEIGSGIHADYEGASEMDRYDDVAYYRAMLDHWLSHGKITHQEVKSPTTGRRGWKFIMTPTWDALEKVGKQAVDKYLKDQAQHQRRR